MFNVEYSKFVISREYLIPRSTVLNEIARILNSERGTFILITYSFQLSENIGEILKIKFAKGASRDFTRILIPRVLLLIRNLQYIILKSLMLRSIIIEDI